MPQTTPYPKRLIEVDLPIKRISAHARREKSIRHGHISTLHIWWARRPLAACRAVICAALWPDPADKLCPQVFIDTAKDLMLNWAKNHLQKASADSLKRFTVLNNNPEFLDNPYELRRVLLDFIADLSDFFYSWLKRSLSDTHPDLFNLELTPKEDECVSLSHRAAMYRHKDSAWFENMMSLACGESCRVGKKNGIGIFVFANKETSGWEAMLTALINSGWTITGSWPIDTEMGNRLRARNSAALASSIHLVCRPRNNNDIGDWRDILQELPQRIHEWMPRLAVEGVVGADAIFACLGPALEIFSRYSSVEKASGELVTLKEYLEYVWAAVSREALSMIFSDADATGFEEDARLTAMWLWTLSTGTVNGESGVEATEEETDDDDEESSGKSSQVSGYVLEFDAARKIAQGLGAHLENLNNLVEVKGDKARLLPVSERTRYLFGKEEARAPAKRKNKREHPVLAETPKHAGTER